MYYCVVQCKRSLKLDNRQNCSSMVRKTTELSCLFPLYLVVALHRPLIASMSWELYSLNEGDLGCRRGLKE